MLNPVLEAASLLSVPQMDALRWLAGEDVPAWYDSAHLSTLKALEKKGLVDWLIWDNNEVGPRPYWVKPTNGVLDHYGPVLTTAGKTLIQTVERPQ